MKKKPLTRKKASASPQSKKKSPSKSLPKQQARRVNSKALTATKRTSEGLLTRPRRRQVPALVTYEVDIAGTRIEYAVIYVSDTERKKLRREGIRVPYTAPDSVADAFKEGYLDSSWIASTVRAFADNTKLRVIREKKFESQENYRKPDRDLIFAWIETDEYATASVLASRARDIVLRLSTPHRLRIPHRNYALSAECSVVSPCEVDVEYTGGGAGNYELMYIQKGGDELRLILDADSDPSGVILRLDSD